MTVHELKVWPAYFEALLSRAKTFEVRKDDRRFKVGDHLELREWDPVTGAYTGRSTFRTVTYVLAAEDLIRLDEPPLKNGYVVLGLGEVQ